MDKVRKRNNSACYTPSSEPYSIYLYTDICLQYTVNINRQINDCIQYKYIYKIMDISLYCVQRVGLRVPVGSRIFSSSSRPDLLWGPPNLLSNRYRKLFPRGVKRPGRESHHSPPTSVELNKSGSIHPLPQGQLYFFFSLALQPP
jgi:hypothetical protein